jgi:O-antigen/teichoic acid export membrane protein
MESSRQIKYGAILSYVGIAIYILIGLLYTPWMIKIIGQDDYGLYTLAYSIIALFVFDFGISAAIQRFVAKYLAENDTKRVDHCLSTVCRLYIGLDIIIALVLFTAYLFIPEIYRELSSDQISKLKVIFLMASVFSVISFPFIPLNGILSAYEKFVQLKVCDILSKLAIVLSCVVCLSLGYGLYALVLSNVLAGIISMIVKIVIVKKDTNIHINIRYHDNQELKDILKFSGWTMTVALCQRCIFNLSPTILGVFDSAAAIAILGIAISLEAYSFTFAYALNGMFLPKISRIFKAKGNLLPLMIRVGRIQVFTIGFIFMGFCIVGNDFIKAWVGNGYIPAYLCSILLIAPAFFLLPADIADQALIASGKVKYRAKVYIWMAVINLILAFPLAKIWGVKGVCLSIFIAYMIRNYLLYRTYRKILKLNISLFLKSTYLKMLPAIIAALLPSLLFIHFIHLSGWYDVICKLGIFTVCYLISFWFMAFNKEEKALICSIAGKYVK